MRDSLSLELVTVERVCALRFQGKVWKEIAHELHVSPGTLAAWRARHPEWQDALRDMVNENAARVVFGLQAKAEKAVQRFDDALDGNADSTQLSAADKIVNHVLAFQERMREDARGQHAAPAEYQSMSNEELAALAAGGDDAEAG